MNIFNEKVIPWNIKNLQDNFDATFLNTNSLQFEELNEYSHKKGFPIRQRLAAEGILLREICGLPNTEIPASIRKISVFGDNTPTLANFEEAIFEHAATGAMAVFPLDGERVELPPSYARGYLFRGLPEAFPDQRSLLTQNSLYQLKRNEKIYIQKEDMRDFAIDGNSWQLAVCMCRRAIEEGVPEYKKILASKWLLSGAVSDHEIKRVELGNKPELNLFGRTPLLPQDNKKDAEQRWRNGESPLFASTVNTAWKLISGKGTIPQEIEDIDEHVKVLHTLVGGAVNPVVAVSLLINPKKLVLWFSHVTAKVAQSARKIIEAGNSGISKVELKEIPSDDIAKVEAALGNSIEETGGVKYINTTGGNRLMGFAALLVAQTHKIPVVYRDIDAQPHQLTRIRFGNNDQVESGIVRGKAHQGINWEYLYSKEERNLESEEIIKKIWRKKD